MLKRYTVCTAKMAEPIDGKAPNRLRYTLSVYDFVSSRLNLLKIFSACETVRNCCVMSSDSDEVDVLYCDYGTTEFVARSDIITQFPEVFQSSIHTVHLCHLDGLLPVG